MMVNGRGDQALSPGYIVSARGSVSSAEVLMPVS